MKHAILSASGSGQWLNCPGSVNAQKAYPDIGSSPAAQEGTCAHELAALCLLDKNSPPMPPQFLVGETLKDAPEITVTTEMANYVEEYINYVLAIPGKLYVETRVDFSDWVPEGFGTSDAIIADDENGVLHVVDLKYGKGVEVSPIENTQGMLYALGAYVEYDFAHTFDKIVIHIYQPRMKNISEWSLSVEHLLMWAETIVKPTAELCMTDDAPRVAGEKQCMWCAYQPNCPELKAHVEKTIGAQFSNLELIPVEEVPDIQNVMDNKKLIEGWLKAIEGHIFDQLESGAYMPGYKIVEGRSIRAWQDVEAAEKLLRSKAYKVNDIFTKKFFSPAQAQKLMGKKYDQISHLVHKPAGKPVLAKDSDKREAINVNVSDDFENIE